MPRRLVIAVWCLAIMLVGGLLWPVRHYEVDADALEQAVVEMLAPGKARQAGSDLDVVVRSFQTEWEAKQWANYYFSVRRIGKCESRDSEAAPCWLLQMEVGKERELHFCYGNILCVIRIDSRRNPTEPGIDVEQAPPNYLRPVLDHIRKGGRGVEVLHRPLVAHLWNEYVSIWGRRWKHDRGMENPNMKAWPPTP